MTLWILSPAASFQNPSDVFGLSSPVSALNLGSVFYFIFLLASKNKIENIGKHFAYSIIFMLVLSFLLDEKNISTTNRVMQDGFIQEKDMLTVY